MCTWIPGDCAQGEGDRPEATAALRTRTPPDSCTPLSSSLGVSTLRSYCKAYSCTPPCCSACARTATGHHALERDPQLHTDSGLSTSLPAVALLLSHAPGNYTLSPARAAPSPSARPLAIASHGPWRAQHFRDGMCAASALHVRCMVCAAWCALHGVRWTCYDTDASGTVALGRSFQHAA